jgi:Tfp pilus assembly PilM family ATPase/Tfp pilus assembly protein PilN
MLFQTSLGVDIGAHELRLACLKASSRDVQLLAHAVYSFEEGIHGEAKSKAVSRLIEGFIRENKISPAAIFLGIPRQTVILRYLELPVSVKENLRETLGYELEKHVPFVSEEVYFDFQIISEDKSSDRLQLLLVVARKEALSTVLAVSEHLSFGVSGIGITATALADYFSWRSKKDNVNSRSFIYARGDHLELGLVKDGMLVYSRDLPRNEGTMEAITGILSKMRLDFSDDDEPLDAVLCGIEKDDPLLVRFNETSGIDPHRVDLSAVQIPSSDLMAAYGLALIGVRKTSMDINLLPPALRKKPSKLKFYALFGLVSLALLSSLAWGGGVFLQRQWTMDQLDSEINKLASQMKKFEQIKAEKSRIGERIDYLNTFRQGGPPVLDIVKELSEKIPKSAWVSRFTFSEKGLEIEGEAASASQLIPLLEASHMFKDVAFLSAITKARSGNERFRIGLSMK